MVTYAFSDFHVRYRIYKNCTNSEKKKMKMRKKPMSNRTVDQLIQKLKEIRIQETKVLDQLEKARSQETHRALQAPTINTNSNIFKKGDEVNITNKIRLPKGRTVTSNDHLAVVSNTRGDKVYFTTNNGTKTWRLYKNLQLYQLLRFIVVVVIAVVVVVVVVVDKVNL